MKRNLVCIAVSLMMCIMFTGCSVVEPMYTLTEEEEDAIVAYSAKIISKYNRRQGDGFTRVTKPKEEKESYSETETPAPAPEENTDLSIEGGEGTAEGGSATSGDGSRHEAVNPITFEDAFGLSNASITYNGFTISDHYMEDNVISLDAKEGKDFLCMKFTITGKDADVVMVDILSLHPRFHLYTDASNVVDNDNTVLMHDMATFQDAVSAEKGSDVVLLFQVPKGSVSEDADNLALTMTMDGKDYDIIL